MIPRNHPAPLPTEAPLLQWANGRVDARRFDARERFAPLVGWHSECGKDDAFDRFADAAALPRIEVRHRRNDERSAAIVTHWFLGERIRLYPITAGPPTTSMNAAYSDSFRRRTIAAGLGVRWGANERSRLAVRGVVEVTTPSGDAWRLFPAIVQITVRSLMTDALLAALVDHIRVCEIADQMIDRRRHADPVALYELALPLAPDEERAWGRRQASIVTPLRSLHPTCVTREYLRSIWRPCKVAEIAEREWDGIRQWAAQFSALDPQSDAAAETTDGDSPSANHHPTFLEM